MYLFCAVLSIFAFSYFPISNGDLHFNSNYDSFADYQYYTLDISQDGPVILDLPVTFTARLLNVSISEEFLFEFEDNVEPLHKVPQKGNDSVQVTFTYQEPPYKPGYYTMKVSCYTLMLENKSQKIASTNFTFQITRYIPGKLEISGVTPRYDKVYGPTGKVINMTVKLDLPVYIQNISEMSYSWTIDKDKFITSYPYNNYQFQEPGTYDVHVTIVARIPIYDNDSRTVDEIRYKWGYVSQMLEIKAPFNAINLTGNTYLKHGQLFNLEVSCNGSGPFEYCWKVLHPSENVTNMICLSPVVTTKCSFPIIYYFNPSGEYRVIIAIDNFVSSMQRNVEVHIYDVSLRPQLSTVIIPLFCSVVVIFIIAAGVMFHLRRNQQFDIEIADFDFLQSDVSVVETFWERLYQSVCNICGKSSPESESPLSKRDVAHSSSYNSPRY